MGLLYLYLYTGGSERDLRCEGTVESTCGIMQRNSEDRSVFWEVTVSVMEDVNVCLILNAEKERQRESCVSLQIQKHWEW